MMTTTTTATTKAHYESHSADSYEQAFFYQAGAYTERLCELVQERLQLNNNNSNHNDHNDHNIKKRLLDIGGGTGNFTRMLVQNTNATAVVVDPFLESSNANNANQDDRVTFVAEPAEAFINPPPSTDDESCWWRTNYDIVLLKEVAHHFADEDRKPMFRGMWNGLRPSTDGAPSLLLITRPKYEIDYPLWDEARAVWAQNQPSLELFEAELKEAGFIDIQHTIEPYPCSIALEKWQTMIKARFWSTFSNFTDEALEEACERIANDEKHRVKDGVIHFEDRLLFITAKKV